LQSFEIPFQFIDLAADEEAKLYMRRKNGGATELPQIFVDGEFRGVSFKL
jgi:glutaredoxin